MGQGNSGDPNAPQPGQVLVGVAIEVTGDGAANSGIILTNQTNQASNQTGTLTNAPTATNPAIWIPVMVNGVLRKIPCW